MQIVFEDQDIVVCVKPARALSTDEPGGVPDLLRAELGTEDFRTVHRLDRVVAGLMVVVLSMAMVDAARPRRVVSSRFVPRR